jgi:hypothetical protein
MIMIILTKVVATDRGNSAATRAKLAVKNAALPRASTIRTMYDKPIKSSADVTRSRILDIVRCIN